MSRIGKMPVPLPKGVTAKIDGSNVTVKGPRGELSRTFYPGIEITEDNGTLTVTRPTDSKQYRALHGLSRALLANMVTGVSNGFQRVLDIQGVGYRAELQGNNLVLSVGYSHPVPIEPPTGIKFSVDKTSRLVTIDGNDKEVVGEVAAKIRRVRPPEPYKGKGILYQGERVRRKAGKTGKAKK
ncbi:MAG: 50S ribosomal protein L6 [Anaerolineae bacterium]